MEISAKMQESSLHRGNDSLHTPLGRIVVLIEIRNKDKHQKAPYVCVSSYTSNLFDVINTFIFRFSSFFE